MPWAKFSARKPVRPGTASAPRVADAPSAPPRGWVPLATAPDAARQPVGHPAAPGAQSPPARALPGARDAARAGSGPKTPKTPRFRRRTKRPGLAQRRSDGGVAGSPHLSPPPPPPLPPSFSAGPLLGTPVNRPPTMPSGRIQCSNFMHNRLTITWTRSAYSSIPGAVAARPPSPSSTKHGSSCGDGWVYELVFS